MSISSFATAFSNAVDNYAKLLVAGVGIVVLVFLGLIRSASDHVDAARLTGERRSAFQSAVTAEGVAKDRLAEARVLAARAARQPDRQAADSLVAIREREANIAVRTMNSATESLAEANKAFQAADDTYKFLGGIGTWAVYAGIGMAAVGLVFGITRTQQTADQLAAGKAKQQAAEARIADARARVAEARATKLERDLGVVPPPGPPITPPPRPMV